MANNFYKNFTKIQKKMIICKNNYNKFKKLKIMINQTIGYLKIKK